MCFTGEIFSGHCNAGGRWRKPVIRYNCVPALNLNGESHET